jgi:KaiC/GvpD/RAD55 family RecA-like ATPase
MASVIYLAKKEGLQWPPVATTAQVVERALVAPDTGRYALRRPSELANAKPAGWLIKGVLPAADLVVLYGASGAGKSFVALDMAAAIARGVPWRGRRTTKGVVVYIAAEGGGGMGNRFKAYAAHHNINLDELDVVTITAAPNFLDLDDVTEVIAKINTLPAVTTIVVDTLAQVTPGANENGAEDMGRALANARTLREATGATVVIIHHAGKDLSRGSRGWSGIKAAADAEIEVRRHEDGGREIAVSKIREGDDSARWGFRLDTVVLGVDEDGDAITSCVAVEVEPLTRSADGPGPKSLSLYEGHVLEVIATLGAQDKIPFSRLVDVATDALPTGGPHNRDVRRNNVVRAIQTLSRQKDGAIRLVGQTVIFYK